MSRISKKKERSWRLRKKRWKLQPKDYDRRDDTMAIVAADLADWQWKALPEESKEIYRARAEKAFSVFSSK
jgi:hypothetical protein